jgi:KaiC/GvpD/RAD55 family RecA-like ATPase
VIPLHTPTPDGCSCGTAPCESPGKHPRTTNGLKGGTTEPDKISRWWRSWPYANIGIVTGPQSGLCVLDVDGEEGMQSLAKWDKQHSIPPTLRVVTGTKDANGKPQGFHLYFRLPSGWSLRNSAGRLGNGLDVRCDGGYVVAPPSRHTSGLHYKWCSSEIAPAEAPEWLMTSMAPGATNRKAAGTIAEGQRNSALARIAGAMRRHGCSLKAIESALLEENLERVSPPLAIEEVRRIAASVSNYPSELQDRKTLRERRPDLVRLSDVAPKAVSWLWEPYLPLEMITVLSGDPGVGKTFISLAIAAALTRGHGVVGEGISSPANVLYLTLENSAAHVLRPRFDAQGGDTSRLIVMRGTLYRDGDTEKQDSLSLADVDQLESAISETHARMVVIDPLQSFLGAKVDLHRSNETRPVLDGILKLAERHSCAVLIVRHLSKGQGGRPLYRGLGSIDITGAARSELFVAADPYDADRRIMAHAKSNLGKLGHSLSYAISDEGRLVWGGKSDLGAGDLLAECTSEQQSAVEEATEFLQEVLSGGAQFSKEIKEQARARGISFATLRRAQDRLGVIKRPNGLRQSWLLELPTVTQDSLELFISKG